MFKEVLGSLNVYLEQKINYSNPGMSVEAS